MTATTEIKVRCTSCGKPKNSLKNKKSKLLPGVEMNLCQDCLDNKFEPRAYVILAGRTHGADYIAAYIKPQRYHGEPITVRELT